MKLPRLSYRPSYRQLLVLAFVGVAALLAGATLRGLSTLEQLLAQSRAGADRALEFADRAINGLMRAAGVVLHDDGFEADQPRLERAMDVVFSRLGRTIDVRQVGLDPGDAFAEAPHRVVHDAREVLGHELTAVGMRI